MSFGFRCASTLGPTAAYASARTAACTTTYTAACATAYTASVTEATENRKKWFLRF